MYPLPTLWVTRPALLVAGIAFAVSGAEAQANSGMITGTVTSLHHRDAIEGATVVVEGTDLAATTDAAGRFSIGDLASGRHRVTVRALGHQALAVVVPVDRADTVQLEIGLLPLPTELAGVVVEGTAAGAPSPRLRGFFERRAAGRGSFFTREDIERRAPANLGDLLRTVPGVQVRDGMVVMGTPRAGRGLGRAAADGCPLAYFVDGMRWMVTPRGIDDFRPDDVEGIEVYRGLAETPLAFRQGGTDACGVIAIWTRVPG